MKHDVTIIKGSEEEITYIKNVPTSTFEYNRDMTALTTSSFKIYEQTNEIAIGDIVLFQFDIGNICGKVTEVKFENNVSTIKFVANSEMHEFEVFMPDNKLEGYTINENYYTSVYIDAQSSDVITTTDENLTLDTLIRQSFRKSAKSETVEFDTDNNIINIVVRDIEEEVRMLRYDDPGIKYTLEYGTDTFNWLRWRNEEDQTLVQDYFLKSDGTVTQDVNESQRPLIQKVDFVEDETDISAATSELKEQEYSNKLTISTPVNSPVDLLSLDQYTIGRRMQFIGPGENVINTFISGITIKNNVLKITCGLTRTKLTDKINREV